MPAACVNTALRLMVLLATTGFAVALWDVMAGETVNAIGDVATKGAGVVVSVAVTSKESLPTTAFSGTEMGAVLQMLSPKPSHVITCVADPPIELAFTVTLAMGLWPGATTAESTTVPLSATIEPGVAVGDVMPGG